MLSCRVRLKELVAGGHISRIQRSLMLRNRKQPVTPGKLKPYTEHLALWQERTEAERCAAERLDQARVTWSQVRTA